MNNRSAKIAPNGRHQYGYSPAASNAMSRGYLRARGRSPTFAPYRHSGSEQWDRELSWESVRIALRTVRLAERETYPQALEEYLRANRARLERMWQVYGPDGLFSGVYYLVELPESFVLCERIEHNPLWLSQLWAKEVGEDTPLERLQEAWLYGTSEKDGR